MVWRVGVAPGDWKNAVIVPKKGQQIECTDYRGTSVMSIAGKVFARVLNERVKVRAVDKLTEEQGGFRVGRGCVEQVFFLREVVEKTIEKDKEVYMTFVDLEKSYDKVSREKQWMVLEEKLLKAIQALYDRCV